MARPSAASNVMRWSPISLSTFGDGTQSNQGTLGQADMPPFRHIAILVTAVATLQAQTADRPTGFPAVCAPGEVQVMLVGTYHFANPGRDVIKQDIDDVLQPKRQAELEDLVARIALWKPDRVAVEWPISQTDTARARYASYRAKTLPPNRNEVVQIGFR